MKDRRNVDFGTEKVSISEIRESVGILFFVWSGLERALSDAVNDLDDSSAPIRATRGIAQTLALWKELHISNLPQNTLHSELIQELFALFSEGLEIRNRLAHGINGWQVGSGDGSDAYISTLLNEKEVTIRLAELRSITLRLGSMSSQLSRITSFALNPNKCTHSVLHSEIRDLLQRSRAR